MLAHRKKFIIFQSIFLLFLWSLGDSQSPILLISGFWLISIYAWLAVKEIKLSLPIPSPICFWILILILRTGIAALYIWILLIDNYPIIFTGYRVGTYVHQGLIITIFSDFLILFSYFIVDIFFQDKFKEGFFSLHKNSVDDLFRYGLVFFVFSLILRLFEFFGIHLIPFGSFFVKMSDSGGIIFMMVMVVMAIIKPQDKVKSFKYILLVFLSEIPFALIGNSKESIILLFVPLFIYYLKFNIDNDFNRGRKALSVVTIGLIIYFVVMVFFPLNQMKREEYGGKQDASFSFVLERATELFIASFPWTDEFTVVHRLPNKGIWYALSRSNMLAEGGFIYNWVENSGSLRDQWYFFKLGAMMLTPRILWPEKSKTNFGVHATYLINRASSPEMAHVSLSYGFAGFMLFQGGFPFLIIFSLMHGALFCISWQVAHHYLSTVFLASFLYFYLIQAALKSFEGFADAGITFYGQYFIIYVFLTYLIAQVTGRHKRVKVKFR